MAKLQTYRIGRLTLRARRELVGPNGPVSIGGRALDLLSTLAEADGALIAKDDLCEAVWGSAIVEENALQAQVAAARKALDAEARRLVTVYGRGYRLDLDARSERSASDRESIAILPFENLSGDAVHGYFADGLVEELITILSRVRGLEVAARTSSFSYRGRPADIRAIAAELGVTGVVEGSIRASADRVRIGVQLVAADSGFMVWSESFERTMGDLLSLQIDLASAIAGRLRCKLEPESIGTSSAEAMRLVLQARGASRSVQAKGLGDAVRFARAALELDPSFGKAWESLAESTFVMAGWGLGPEVKMSEARGYAMRAIEIDPSLIGARTVLGGIEATSGRFVEASETLESAQALDPGNGSIREHAALGILLPTGLSDRAAQQAKESLSTSSAQSSTTLAICAICAWRAGDTQAARRYYRESLQLRQPTSLWLLDYLRAELAEADGDVETAASAMASLVEREWSAPTGASIVHQVYDGFCRSAARAAASEALTFLVAEAERSGTLWGHYANIGIALHWQTRLGNIDAAFSVAQRIVRRWRETGQLATASLGFFWLADMAPFRRDPRFQELVRDLDLIRFWQRHGPPDGHVLEGDRLIVATAD